MDDWAAGRQGYKAESEAAYLKEREELLRDLTEQGREARSTLRALEQSLEPTEASCGATRAEGYDVEMQHLKSHVHVRADVMGRLDNIYRAHYRPAGVEGLRRCLRMRGSSAGDKAERKRYRGYLVDVRDELETLGRGADTLVECGAGNLQAFGLKHAHSKLLALYTPTLGKINLPLATASMLEDLRACLEIDQHVMGEVRHHHARAAATLTVPHRSAVGSTGSGITSSEPKATTRPYPPGPTWWTSS